MADITKTIKASGGDYSTVTAWEADLDDSGIYSASDVAIGEMYDFISESSEVLVNGGGTIGLAGWQLIGESGSRHDGTPGGAAGVNYTGTGDEKIIFATSPDMDMSVDWLEFDGNGDDPDNAVTFDKGTGGTTQSTGMRHCVAYRCNGLKQRGAVRNVNTGFIASADGFQCHNNIFFDFSTTAQSTFMAINFANTGTEDWVFNNTVYKIHCSHATRNSRGIYSVDNGVKTIKNNLVVDVTVGGSGAATCYEPAMEYSTGDTATNGSSDATGSSGITSLTTGEFVSTTSGSEDLHLAASSTSEDAGTDLGTTDGAHIDIDGEDRDAGAVTWDIGAHEYELPASGATDLVVADGAHAHAADNLALTQIHVLVVADGAHAHAADNVVLTQDHALVIAEALHPHAADALTLTQVHQLAIAEALHAHAAGNLTLTQVHNLVIAESLHAHAADNVVLSTAGELVIQDAVHAQTAENIALVQQHALAVADSLHGHIADNLTLTQAHNLTVADALHAHAADNVTLTLLANLIIADTLHALSSDGVVLTQTHLLAIADAVHAHLSPNREMVPDPGFDDPAAWSPGAGWSVAGGAATKVAGTADTIGSGGIADIQAGKDYPYSVTIANYGGSGSLFLSFPGFVTAGPFNANGTHTGRVATTSGGNSVVLTADNVWSGDVTDISLTDDINFAQVHNLSIADALHAQLADNIDLTLILPNLLGKQAFVLAPIVHSDALADTRESDGGRTAGKSDKLS